MQQYLHTTILSCFKTTTVVWSLIIMIKTVVIVVNFLGYNHDFRSPSRTLDQRSEPEELKKKVLSLDLIEVLSVQYCF